MICAHCKQSHPSVADVRVCATKAGVLALPGTETRLNPAPTGVARARAAGLTVSGPGAKITFADARLLLPNVPTSYYATKGYMGLWEFYRVDRPQTGKWAGYIFVKRQASDDFYPVKGANALAVIAKIAADPSKAVRDYGHQLGRCGICHRTLTVAASIEAGIGPVCASRL